MRPTRPGQPVSTNSGHRLQLKSSTPGSTPQPSHVVLCTPSQTYQLRQVQSSNTVFITRPAPCGTLETGATDTSVCVFAKCSSILETHPPAQVNDGHIKDKTARDLVQCALRVYSGSDDNVKEDALETFCKQDLFNDVPFSQGECEEAWRDLMAFQWQHACWQASPEVLIGLWDRIIETTQAEGIHLEFSFDVDDLKSKLDESNTPIEIMAALLCKLCQTSEAQTVSAKLDRATTVKWTGELTNMMTAALSESTTTAELLLRWQNRLPEVWRQDATLESVEELKLNNSHHKELKNTLKPLLDNTATAMVTGAKRPMKGRNWHERFKKLRN